MAFDNELIAGKLRRWETYLQGYSLPEWENIPDLGLYMDQVIIILTKYLDYLPPEIKEEQIITPAAINNYVRKGYMPAPVKKKYYRVHIAYLVMICTLKQGLNITELKGLIPKGLSEDEFEKLYDGYINRHRLVAGYFVDQVRKISAGILKHEPENELSTDAPDELIVTSAVISGFSRLLAEKLLLLNDKTVADGGSIEKRKQ